MFQSRQAARLYSSLAAFLIAASWATFAVAQSTDQWRAAGSRSTSAAQSSAATSNPNWQLPTSQSTTGEAALVDEDSNPLRKPQPAKQTANATEPRAFQPSANAAPMSAARSTANNPQQNVGQQNRVASRPAPVSQAYLATPEQQASRAPAHQQRPFVQPNNRQPANNQLRNTQPQSRNAAWDAINVAFQDQPGQLPAPPDPTSKLVKPTQPQSQAAQNRQSENLPMPGGSSTKLQDPTMRWPGGPGEYIDSFGGPAYQPYCEDGSCSMGCAGPCCGDTCEPGCDCPSDNCNKEVFCIGPGDDESCHIVQVRWPKWQEVVLFGGVQGFKGPYDRERDSGNFGFNEGFNIGAKVPYAQLGYQFGYRAAQSQLNGDKDTGIDQSFNQSFVTAGLFHRQAEGLNFGVVWDGLVDERWGSQSFNQIRTEFSVIGCGCHEIGFNAIVGTNSNALPDPNVEDGELNYQASDQYLLFYRMHGPNGGEGRIFAGVNNDSDGILGADTLIPIGGSFSLESAFTYLIPSESNGTGGATNEAWNVGVGLVWHWDGQARKCYDNCYRPMFNVANNGILIVDQQ